MRVRLIVVLMMAGAVAVAAQKTPVEKPARKSSVITESRYEQMAVAGAAAIQGADRASVFMLLGYANSTHDKEKARGYYEQALAAFQQFQDEKVAGTDALTREIVTGFAVIAPEAEMGDLSSDPSLRDAVLLKVVDSRIGKKQVAAAVEAYRQMQTGPDVYIAAAALISAAPEGDTGFLPSVFEHAFTVYRGSKHRQSTIGHRADLTVLILRCWKSLPRKLALEAVDSVLDEAKEESKRSTAPWTVSMQASGGAVTFKTAYEYRVYELSTVLKELDPSRMKELEQQFPVVRDASVLFPSDENATTQASDTGKLSLSWDSRSAMESVHRLDNIALRDKLASEVEKDDPSSVRTAAQIPDAKLRVSVLVELATHYVAMNPDVAKEAVAQIAAADTACSDLYACFSSIQVASKLKETELAEKLLRKGFKTVELYYKKDSDPNDPNRALKLFWPSTLVWRNLLTWQAKLNPTAVDDSLKAIPDEDIKAIEAAFLVGQNLNGKAWNGYSPMVSHKNDR